MRIYLDHCAYNRPFDDQRGIKVRLETAAKLYIQGRIRHGKYELVWSYMSDIENSVNPNVESRNAIQELPVKTSRGLWLSTPLTLFEWREGQMMTEIALRTEAINLLLKTFGVLETEKFISGIKNSDFDYTEWQKNLWNDKSVDEIHLMATEFEKNRQNLPMTT